MAQHLEAITEQTPAAPQVHESIIHSPEFWIAASFLIFAALFFNFVWPLIGKQLDNRSNQIRDQLEQANRLRAEAEAVLAAYQTERAAKEKEAEEIILNAKRDAKALRERAEADLKTALDRRSQQAVEKIERAERDATAFIRTQMIDIAVEAASEIVRTKLSAAKAEDPAVARALTAIGRQIH